MDDLCLSDLEELPASHVAEAAALAAAAFLNSPGYLYIFEDLDDEARLAALTWLFETNFRLRLGTANTNCAFSRVSGKDPQMVSTR